MTPSLRLALTLLLLACPPFSRAQDAGEPQPPIPLRFFYATEKDPGSDGGDPRLDFILGDGRNARPFKLGPNSLSPRLLHQGPPPVALHREIATADGVEREMIGRLEFPPTWKGVLFLAFPTGEHAPLPFRFVPVEYWGPSVPENHARIVNLCPAPIAGRIAGRDVLVPAGQNAEIDISAATHELPVKLALQRPERWQMLLSSALRLPAGGRMVFVVFPSDASFHTARILTFDNLPLPVASVR